MPDSEPHRAEVGPPTEAAQPSAPLSDAEGTERTTSSKSVKWLVVSAAGGLILGVVGTLAAQAMVGTVGASSDHRLAQAFETCSPAEGVELADEGQTIVIDVQGEEDRSGATYEEQACILSELGAPSSVSSHIGQTTSLDGRQSASWSGIEVEWSFHPNRGSDMVITLDSDR